MFRTFLAASLILLIAPSISRAESSLRPKVEESTLLKAPSSTLTWKGRTIFEFRESLGSISPADRLKLAEAHLDLAVKNTTPPWSDHLRFVATPHSIDFFLDEFPLFSLFEKDAEALQVQKEWLASQVLLHLKSALSNSEVAVVKPLLGLRPELWAAIYLVGYALIIALLLRGFSWSLRTLEQWKLTPFAQKLTHSLRYFTSERIFGTLAGLVSLLRFAMIAVLTYLMIPLVLSVFPWGAAYSPKLLALVLDPVREITTVAVDYLPKLFFILVTGFFTRLLLKVSRWFFDEVKRGTIRFEGFHEDWAEPTFKLARILILAFSLIVIFPYLPGAGSPAFQGVSVFIGVLISFGSGSAISNAIAGFVLTYMRPFQPGDHVRIGGTMGDVIEKGILVTRVRTIKNVDITIPNSQILNNHIENFSKSARSKLLILNSTVTLGYDTPWPMIHELLIKAAERTPRILPHPKPFVLQTALNDFTVSYQINAYTDEASIQVNTYSDLHASIQEEFAEAGVEIMSPQYLSIRNGNDTMLPKNASGENGHSRSPFEVHSI